MIHPFEKQNKVDPNGNDFCELALKRKAIVPHKATKEDAEWYFRYFCHIIDRSGGESPHKGEKVSRTYPSLSDQMRQLKEERRQAKIPRKGKGA